jgi:CheY-like chemotaxis protein
MKKILVVDDEIAIVELLSSVFEEEGYEVLTALNGHQGLARIASTRPNLILSDFMMPMLDGLGMCKAIQSDPIDRTIPFVLMTAASKSAIRANGCEIATFISKPFDVDNVVDVVARLAGGPDDHDSQS